MRISIRTHYTESDVRQSTIADMREAARAGYEALELCVVGGPQGLRGPCTDLTSADVDAIIEAGEETGVPVTSLSSDWVWQYGTADRPLSDWEEGVEGLAKDAELARQIGASYSLCHLAESHGTWDEAKDILAAAGDAAAEQGVRFGYEASLFVRCGLGQFDDLLRMLDELDHPAMGAYDHCWYPERGRPAHVQVEQIGERLYGYHSSLLTPETTDYGKLFDAMKRVGYKGDWVFEISWEHAEEQCTLLKELMKAAE